MHANYNARSYLPGLGIFAQVDPIDVTPERLIDPQQLNPYAYVRGNPLKLVDPSGENATDHRDKKLIDGGSGGGANLTALAIQAARAGIVGSPALTEATMLGLVRGGQAAGREIVKGIYRGLVVAGIISSTQNSSVSYIKSESSVNGNQIGSWEKAKHTSRFSMSERAIDYHMQITEGIHPETAYVVGGVEFDGYTNGTLLDAKGLGYEKFVKNGEFQAWFAGADALVNEAERQIAAAGDNARIEWHVADERSANAIRALLEKNEISGIQVIYTKPVK